MKNLIFIFFLLTLTTYSQENKYEKIKALKTAYITEQLDLTPSEAEKFWPIYNTFDKKFHKLRHRKREEIYEKLHLGIDKLNDEEANKLIDEFLLLETEQLNLEKEKTASLRQVISPKKIIGLRKAEDDFKRELLDRYRRGKEKGNEQGKRKP